MIIANHDPDLFLAVPGTNQFDDLTSINTFGLFPVVAWHLNGGVELKDLDFAEVVPVSFETCLPWHWAIYHQKTFAWWMHGCVTGTGDENLISTFVELYETEPPVTANPMEKVFPVFP